MTRTSFRRRVGGVVGVCAAACLVTLLLPPIPQWASYHAFCDDRPWLGIPNAANVLTNLPFVLIGAWGLLSRRVAEERWERLAWTLLAGAVFAVGFGSAYYHWAPTDDRLFWDRLPMTVIFTSLLAITIGERIGVRLLLPLLAAGVAGLLYWRWAGDTRLYGLLQGLAIALIPLMLALFPARYSRSGDVWAAFGLYAVAKLAEHLDGPIHAATGGWTGGHPIKHVLAAAAIGTLLVHARRRTRLGASTLGRPDGRPFDQNDRPGAFPTHNSPGFV